MVVQGTARRSSEEEGCCGDAACWVSKGRIRCGATRLRRWRSGVLLHLWDDDEVRPASGSAEGALGRARLPRFAASKIQRTCEGGAVGHGEVDGAVHREKPGRDSPETTTNGGGQPGLRRGNSPSTRRFGWGFWGELEEEIEGFL